MFEKSSKKVVLVDCDMRRPNIHKKFKISNSTGLSEILTGQSNKIKDNYNIIVNDDIADAIGIGHAYVNKLDNEINWE